MSSQPKNSEPEDVVNSQIDELAKKAFSKAYAEALASDEGVCAVEDGVLYRIFSDGTREKIKEVAKRLKIDPHKKYTLKA